MPKHFWVVTYFQPIPRRSLYKDLQRQPHESGIHCSTSIEASKILYVESKRREWRKRIAMKGKEWIPSQHPFRLLFIDEHLLSLSSQTKSLKEGAVATWFVDSRMPAKYSPSLTSISVRSCHRFIATIHFPSFFLQLLMRESEAAQQNEGNKSSIQPSLSCPIFESFETRAKKVRKTDLTSITSRSLPMDLVRPSSLSRENLHSGKRYEVTMI